MQKKKNERKRHNSIEWNKITHAFEKPAFVHAHAGQTGNYYCSVQSNGMNYIGVVVFPLLLLTTAVKCVHNAIAYIGETNIVVLLSY